MIQLTEKLFAIEVPLDSHTFEDTKANGVMWQDALGNYDSLYFDEYFIDCERFKIIGCVYKDTIDFDVVDLLESEGLFYSDYEDNQNGVYEVAEGIFRYLLTSKGSNPDEKHLIIEKI